jgi:hypothetical protein
VALNGFILQQLDMKSAYRYSELNKIIDLSLAETYRDGNQVAYLKRCIDGLIQLPRDWYSHTTAHLQRHGFDISNFHFCVLPNTRDQFDISVNIYDLAIYGYPNT